MEYISAKDVASIILNQTLQVGKDYLIIDVRQDDFSFGNICHCRNIPSHDFMDKLQDYYDELKNVRLLIFHCA
jgi:Cdc25 family phosphatase